MSDMNAIAGRLEIFPEPRTLAHGVAEWIAATLESLGRSRVSLSGGSTPKRLYQLLASREFIDRIPWGRVSWFWGDERFVPPDDPESNFGMVREAMLSKAPAPPENIHPIPTDGSPEEAARRYERTLQEAYGSATLEADKPLFDITLLGLGEDGHTASLLPGDAVLRERRHWVAEVAHGRPETRITLTYPAIDSSRHIAFVVAGREKASMVRAVRSGRVDVPAARLRPAGEVIWFVDQAAAEGR
jgi:6-phosphogluconolactonase